MRAIEKYNELKAIVKRNGPGSQEVSESIKKVVIVNFIKAITLLFKHVNDSH